MHFGKSKNRLLLLLCRRHPPLRSDDLPSHGCARPEGSFLRKDSPKASVRPGRNRNTLNLAVARLALLFSVSTVLPAAGFYNLPISRAPGDQSAPVMVADGGDGAFILWLDQRGAQQKIFCQHLSPFGQPLWQRDGLEAARTAGQHVQFAVMPDGSGGFIVAWQEAAGSDDGEIFAQRLNGDGVRLWGEGGKEIYRGNREQTVPLVIADGAGGAIVLWQDERAGNWDIFAQRVNAGGDKLWNPAGVALVQEARSQLLGDAAAHTGQGFFLAWRDERTTPARVLVQNFDLNGNKVWNAAAWVAQSLFDQSEAMLHVEANNTGSISVYAAWIERRLNIPNVYVQRLNTSGLLQWSILGLAAGRASDEQKEVQLLGAEEGGLILVWEDARNDDGDIYAQRLSRDGRLLWSAAGLAIVRAEQGQYRPRAAGDAAGGFFCVWEEDRNSGTTIAAQRVDAAGRPLWPAAGVFLTDHEEETSTPVILARANGRALAAWSDGRQPSDDIYAQPLAADGKFENVPPLIVSTPPETAYVNTAYAYTIASLDFDSEAQPELAVATAPAWLQLDQAEKTLHGLPSANDRGEFDVQIQASDLEGGRATQNFKLRVLADFSAPAITSRPDTIAREDEVYRYRILASDPNPQEVLEYELETDAAWLSLTSPGELSGTPLNEHVGLHAVKITVTNRQGNFGQQQFQVRVVNTNDPPQITSAAPPRASEGAVYSYKMTARDDDQGDSLTFLATRKPAWLQFSVNGNLSGTPTRNNYTDTLFSLYVRDRADARDPRTYAIPVDLSNTRPRFTSTPPTTIPEDSLYRYQIAINDPDPDEELRLTLQQAPAWLQLDSLTRLLSGTPSNDHVGEHSVSLEVRDRKNARDQQRFTLRVANSNDPPTFTGEMDTVAFVDSLYQYQVTAQDIDAGDRVTITIAQAPAWLTWDAANERLHGTPRLPDAGVHVITLHAQDLSQAVTTQQFLLRVYNLGAPDATAPASPQVVTITPANWSRLAGFTVRWQNPFDPSGITGAFYKMDSPPDGNRDGELALPPAGQTIQEVSLLAPREGKVPFYVWLVDGSGNVDYRTAIRVDCRYDASAPQPPSKLHAGNAFAWAGNDTLRFEWQPATDALSNIARHDLILAGRTIRRLPGAARAFKLDTVLAERKYDWRIAAFDSAGNTATSATASFRVDHTPPTLSHTPLDTVAAEETSSVRATARDQLGGIASVRVLFRTTGLSDFSEILMPAEGGEFVASIPGAAIRSPGLQYVILAADSAGNVGRSTVNADPRAVHAVVVKSQQIPAPTTTRGKYYQLVSIPYRLFSNSPEAVFADNLGAYDPMGWRLYAYAPRAGNIEFGKPEFQPLEPGRAYWLITAKPQAFDAGVGFSVTTAQDFLLELQPGWNLIATPFDFPTDWSTVQRPPLVEAQLWAFNGKQYLAHRAVMQPWQGYFVRNLSGQPQTLVIPPQCAGCATNSPVNSTTSDIPARAGVSSPAGERRNVQETPAYAAEDIPGPATIAAAPFIWQLQLTLRNDEFADTQNWLGVSTYAHEGWDGMELSEPPPAAGEFVSLRFPQEHWQEFKGDFTTDFRPPAAAVEKWVFEVLAAQAGKALTLDFQLTGEFPGDGKMLLQDEDGLVREIDFDENGRAQSLALRSAAAPRRFTLWAGSQDELNKTGLLAAALPQAFSLAPSYPNPARLQAHAQAASTMRFSLPVETEVELTIWNVLGQPVRSLLHQHLGAGHHEILWNGRDDAGQMVAAGVYFCRMKSGQFNAIRKIILLH